MSDYYRLKSRRLLWAKFGLTFKEWDCVDSCVEYMRDQGADDFLEGVGEPCMALAASGLSKLLGRKVEATDVDLSESIEDALSNPSIGEPEPDEE